MPTGAAARPNDDLSPRGQATHSGLWEPGQQAPFAWQDGRRLWILDGRGTEWVLAELLFEPLFCRYLEVRRASYRWPREAAGVLLGRTLASGHGRAEEAARGLTEWLERTTTKSL